jgi:tyrosyl-tRNA synthetase
MEKIGIDIAELLVTVGFAKTKTEARRHIKGGAVRIQDNKVHDPFARLALSGNTVIIVEDIKFREKPKYAEIRKDIQQKYAKTLKRLAE